MATVVRADAPDEGTVLHGVVAADRSEAVYCLARVATSPAALPGRVPLPGLEPGSRYLVGFCPEVSAAGADLSGGAGALPPWLTGAPVEVAGAVLTHAGVVMPLLDPGQAVVLRLTTA